MLGEKSTQQPYSHKRIFILMASAAWCSTMTQQVRVQFHRRDKCLHGLQLFVAGLDSGCYCILEWVRTKYSYVTIIIYLLLHYFLTLLYNKTVFGLSSFITDMEAKTAVLFLLLYCNVIRSVNAVKTRKTEARGNLNIPYHGSYYSVKVLHPLPRPKRENYWSGRFN